MCPRTFIWSNKKQVLSMTFYVKHAMTETVCKQCLPDSIDVSLIWVGGQLQCWVHRGQREHTAIERLLWEGVVGGVILSWHYIHWNWGLYEQGSATCNINKSYTTMNLSAASSYYSPQPKCSLLNCVPFFWNTLFPTFSFCIYFPHI